MTNVNTLVVVTAAFVFASGARAQTNNIVPVQSPVLWGFDNDSEYMDSPLFEKRSDCEVRFERFADGLDRLNADDHRVPFGSRCRAYQPQGVHWVSWVEVQADGSLLQQRMLFLYGMDVRQAEDQIRAIARATRGSVRRVRSGNGAVSYRTVSTRWGVAPIALVDVMRRLTSG